MDVITFFNSKGGSGKSTFTVLYASYLAYGRGLRVKVIDYEYPDHRIVSMRRSELSDLELAGSPLSKYFEREALQRGFYDVEPRGMSLHRQDDRFVFEELSYLTGLTESGQYDCILLDFPAGYSDDSLVARFAGSGYLTKVFIPVIPSWSSYGFTLAFTEMLENTDVKVAAFWTDVTKGSATEEEMMEKCGSHYRQVFGYEGRIPRVPRYRKLRGDSSRGLFVMSTVCWPERYVRLYAPGVLDLFGQLDMV